MGIKNQIKFTVKSLAGKAEYNLEPLTRKEAQRIFHATVTIVVKGLGSVLADFQKSKKIDESKILDLVKSLDFDQLYEIGSAVFKQAVIVNEKGKFEINDLEESDYFDDRPEEFYLAIIHAVKENWPHVFFTLEKTFRAFGESEEGKERAEALTQVFRKTP